LRAACAGPTWCLRRLRRRDTSVEACMPSAVSGTPPGTVPGSAAALSRLFGPRGPSCRLGAPGAPSTYVSSSPVVVGHVSWPMWAPAPSGGAAGVAAPGAGPTAMSEARWRMCSRNEVTNSAEGGAAPVGTGFVPSSSGASSRGWTALSIEEGSVPVGVTPVRRVGMAWGGLGCVATVGVPWGG